MFAGNYMWLRPVSMLAGLMLLLNVTVALAVSEHAETAQVQALLVASVTAVHPGEEVYLGVHQRIIPHWHTYWLNPGDSGIATTIDWQLPKGASASEILWPTPSRSSLGPVTNYSYENAVTLPSKIHVPKDVKPGSVFTANATVDWLVCHEECLPQQVKLSLSLPVVAVGVPVEQGSPLIKIALEQLPTNSPWPISAQSDKDGLTLRIAGAGLQSKRFSDVWFYPAQWGNVAQSVVQTRQIENDTIALKLRHGDVPLKSGELLTGVLVVTTDTANGAVSRGFNVNVIPALAKTESARPVVKKDFGFATALFLALLGGVILNLMPCVFPVLSIKALSLVSHADQSPLQTRLQGVAYTAGVLSSFAILGGVLIALKAGGAQIGWGFQFQSPLFVLVVAYLMFAVGLSLSGVFTIGSSIAGVGSSLANRSGYAGSFFTGVLATIVATPCTAPFMAAALGYALTQPAFKLISIFLSLGLGLALPYLLLTSWPALQRRLPHPGVWMEHVKQLLAFPMYAAAVWLVWVLAQQSGANGVLIALAGMLVIAFAAWLYNSTRNAHLLAQHAGAVVAVLALLSALVGGYVGIDTGVANATTKTSPAPDATKHWQPYSAERLQNLLAEGKPVFLNFTAAWCISCLVNERVALSNSAVVSAFEKSGITYLKGDWTNRDPQITAILAKFGRSGVPLYVLYPAGIGAKPVELPQILTPDIVLSVLNKASQYQASSISSK
jgi:thiol:disulfide interchange protein DsbD